MLIQFFGLKMFNGSNFLLENLPNMCLALNIILETDFGSKQLFLSMGSGNMGEIGNYSGNICGHFLGWSLSAFPFSTNI